MPILAALSFSILVVLLPIEKSIMIIIIAITIVCLLSSAKY